MSDDPVVLERVQELTWALLDEQINDDEMTLLDSLLLADDAARRRYIECVQLHADLMAHYAPPQPAAAAAKCAGSPPILGFLNANTPTSFRSPSPEDAMQ